MATVKEVLAPDLGGATKVSVIEILVKPGDNIQKEASLITLEGEKATMEVPSPYAGEVNELKVAIGDKISPGSLIAIMTVFEEEAKAEEPATPTVAQPDVSSKPAAKTLTTPETDMAHAGPGVRKMAHELNIDLNQVSGTGPKGRILKEDLQNFGKAPGIAMPPAMPQIDFAQFGAITKEPLSRIKRLTGINVYRSWITVPQVTQFIEADITELEDFRQSQNQLLVSQGIKLTPLVFIMQAVVASLKAFPLFNASLDASGENLIYKHYHNIGVAVDTPNGLVVPVIRDVATKSLVELAKTLTMISKKARDKGLTPAEMAGGSFTISSLGGIGGTGFTPIVNAPEVAILGVAKAELKPVYRNGTLMPRLMLPLALSYDHRVIDGADGARFIVYLSGRLADIRTLLL